MNREIERQLMRLLHGELPAEEATGWRRRLDAEPELAALYAELEAVWSRLELPEPTPAGPEIGVVVRRRLEDAPELTVTDMWRRAGAWNRALAAAALVAGIGIGALAGTGSVAAADESLFERTELSLAESYWLALDEEVVDGAEVQP